VVVAGKWWLTWLKHQLLMLAYVESALDNGGISINNGTNSSELVLGHQALAHAWRLRPYQ
jgi:hypothetical protein